MKTFRVVFKTRGDSRPKVKMVEANNARHAVMIVKQGRRTFRKCIAVYEVS